MQPTLLARLPGWRRATTTLIGLALALTIAPAATLAAPPISFVDDAYMTAPAVTTPDGTIRADILFSTINGHRSGMNYDGPLGSWFGIGGWAELDGARLDGEFALYDGASGEFVGWATYALDFTTAGPVATSRQDLSTGNHRSIVDFSEQPVTASGALTMPDGSVFPIDSPGTHLVADVWSNAPRSTILDGSETFIGVDWTVGDMTVTFRVHATELMTASAFIVTTPADPEIIGTATPSFDGDTLRVDVELRRPDRSLAGTAHVELRVTELGSSAWFEVTEDRRLRVIGTDLVVTGTAEFSVDGASHRLDFADGALTAMRQAWHGIQYPFAGGGEG